MDKRLALLLADTPMVRTATDIHMRHYEFGQNLVLAKSYQGVASRLPQIEARLSALQKKHFDLQLARNLRDYNMNEWSWSQEPPAPTDAENEVLSELIELSTQYCHDLKGLEYHAALRFEEMGLDA